MMTIDTFLKELDRAITNSLCDGEMACCEELKTLLGEVITKQDLQLDKNWLKPAEGGYARRLLHKDPQGRYEVRVMVWDKNQGTPIHDHAGLWCVECVYQGQIRVVSYDLKSSKDDRYEFTKEREILAGIGNAGSLIPPYEYHTIDNPTSSPAVTLHIYGGGMNWCHIFTPTSEGDYTKTKKTLSDTFEP